MFEHLEWETIRGPDTTSTTIGLYDKNGRRVRIARKKSQVLVAEEPEGESSDDSADASEFDNLKVVSKRFIKVFFSHAMLSIETVLLDKFLSSSRNKPESSSREPRWLVLTMILKLQIEFMAF